MISRRVLFGSGGAVLLPTAALGQAADDSTSVNIEELAQRVTDLEARVTELELQFKPETAEDSEADQPTEVPDQSASGGPISISGVGTTLSDAVFLDAGLYRVDALVTVSNGFGDYFTLEVAGSNEFDDMIFMEFSEGNGEFEYSSNWTAERSEEYFFQVDCMSSWSVNFVQLR